MTKKFDRVLSDEWLPLEFKSGNDVPVTSLMVNLKTLKSIVEQAEQAVLEKLGEQDPVAYLYDDEVFGDHSGAINEHIRKEGQPLYDHPIPYVSENAGSENQPYTVRCNDCWWHGGEDDLDLAVAADYPEDGVCNVCPQCKKNGCLMDLDPDEQHIGNE